MTKNNSTPTYRTYLWLAIGGPLLAAGIAVAAATLNANSPLLAVLVWLFAVAFLVAVFAVMGRVSKQIRATTCQPGEDDVRSH